MSSIPASTTLPAPLQGHALQGHAALRFEAWLEKLQVSPDTLNGEPAFPGSRLSVRHVGGMLRNGVPLEEIREDYPYLTDEDLEFSLLFD